MVDIKQYITIDWDALDQLTPAERMAALADINTEIRTVTGAERARMAARAVAEHGTQAAAAKALEMKPARFSQIMKERPPIPSNFEISSEHGGRGCPGPYPLLERVQAQYGLGQDEAHDLIHAYLSQLIDLDGEDTVILGRRPIHPGRLDHNPTDLDVHWWLTLSPEAIDDIETAIAEMGTGESADSEDDDG